MNLTPLIAPAVAGVLTAGAVGIAGIYLGSSRQVPRPYVLPPVAAPVIFPTVAGGKGDRLKSAMARVEDQTVWTPSPAPARPVPNQQGARGRYYYYRNRHLYWRGK